MRGAYDHCVGVTPGPGQRYSVIDVDPQPGVTDENTVASVLEVLQLVYAHRAQPPDPIPFVLRTKTGSHVIARAFDVDGFRVRLPEDRSVSVEVMKDGSTVLYCSGG